MAYEMERPCPRVAKINDENGRPIFPKVIVGKNRQEALKLELKYYLGKPCKHGHTLTAPDGTVGTIRYRTTGHCCTCDITNVRKYDRKRQNARNPEYEDAKKQAKARGRAEDIKAAKELGMSLEEYLSL